MIPPDIREAIKDALGSWVSEIEEQKWRGLTKQQFVDERIAMHGAALAWLERQDAPQGEALPGLPELRESIRYILDNSIDEYNETFSETQKHLAVLRKVLNEAQPAPAERGE
jgi:hypothetical protein